jgi:ACR3 family arsenite transporter
MVKNMIKRKNDNRGSSKALPFFEKYLPAWVIVCIVVGVAIGKFLPVFPQTLSKFEYSHVSIPVAVLIWLMIYPMMMKIDFGSVAKAGKKPKGLVITWVGNWLIKPFTMYVLAWSFFMIIFSNWISASLAREYLAGAVLLGAAPCTAMVFVWSYLADGDPNYTLIQVATNDLIILFAFVPIVGFLLGVSNILVPLDTLLLSVVLYVVIPLIAGYSTRKYLIKRKGLPWLEEVFFPKLRNITIIGLLLTLVILFSFQGDVILNNLAHILLIAVPLTLQTFLIFGICYGWGMLWNVKYSVAAPSALVGASNFFELAVAVAISLFGISSGAALATVVGVLVEVPIMLFLVKICLRTRSMFPRED